MLIEARDGHLDIFISLLSDGANQLIKDLVTRALSTYGATDPQQVRNLAQQLFQFTPRRSFNHFSANSDPIIIYKCKAAIDIAAVLGFEEILQAGVLISSDIIRTYAVRALIRLWERDRETAHTILQGVIKTIRPIVLYRSPKQDIQAAYSAGFLTAYALTRHHQFMTNDNDKAIIEKLRVAWRPAIRNLLYYHSYNQEAGSAKKKIKSTARELILDLGINFVISLAHNPSIPTVGGNFRREEGAFFSLSQVDRERVRHIFYTLTNNHTTVSVNDLQDDLILTIDTNDKMSFILIEQALKYHHFNHGEDITPIIQTLYLREKEHTYPTLATASLLEIMFGITHNLGRQIHAQDIQIYGEMLSDFYDTSSDLRVQGQYGNYVTNHLARYFWLLREFDHRGVQGSEIPSPHDLLKKYTYRATEFNQESFARSFLYDIQSLIVQRRYATAFSVLGELLDFESETSLNDIIVNLLALSYTRDPEITERFLEELEAPEAYRQRILTKEIIENPADLVRPYGLMLISEIYATPALWDETYNMFDVVLNAKSLHAVSKYVARRLVNVAYGDDIFKTVV